MSNSTKNILGSPTIRHAVNFNAKLMAAAVQKAIEAKDKNLLIQELCTISNQQRQEVAAEYKVLFGRDLLTDLKKATSGDLENLIISLMELPAFYDAHQMYKAMSGLGTKESVLIEILVTHSNRQLRELKAAYEKEYGHPLEKDIIGDTSGPFQRLLVSLCNCSRDESWNTDPLKANQAARALYLEGEGRKGVNDAAFNQILANENFSQLQLIFDEYTKISGHTIDQAIVNQFSGDDAKGYLAVVECVRNRAAFFAKCLHEATKGFLGTSLGTKDSDLIRLVVSRSECDLEDIKSAYAQLYNCGLEKAVEGDTSGTYRDGLLMLIRGN